ncbi:hypothetical protein M8120_00335 [Microcystis aeruginosa str. Chao 1910]|uniref:hypothetical protein n=1 Tax=Microcystis aeruginosa TaxID=1126 RepID=UPI0022453A59|nr:hypothetical protein [Microcystis aeruginosa]UZO76567.1 hypothetical protein M8120_00335 [Microcystis aeruginosa str. Chao 1910]
MFFLAYRRYQEPVGKRQKAGDRVIGDRVPHFPHPTPHTPHPTPHTPTSHFGLGTSSMIG